MLWAQYPVVVSTHQFHKCGEQLQQQQHSDFWNIAPILELNSPQVAPLTSAPPALQQFCKPLFESPY